MAARHSYLFHILKYLRESRVPCSMEDIFSSLLEAKDILRLEEGRTLTVPNDLGTLHEVLSRLTEIGILRAEKSESGREFWTLSADAANQESEGSVSARGDGDNSGGGRDDRGGGRGGDGPGDDGPEGQGGGGLSEVLAHPVLFCLDEEHQDQLLWAALGILPNDTADNSGEAV